LGIIFTGIITGITLKLPRYIRNLNGSLYYQRDIPTRLKAIANKKTFTHPLKLKIHEATEIAINKATAKSAEAFDVYLKLLSNSDPNAFSATEIDLAVVEFLRKKGLKKGELTTVPPNPEELGPADYADFLVPEIDNLRMKSSKDDKLTAKDTIIERAYSALYKKETARPQTFQSLWKEYVISQNIDIKSRDGKRIQRHWDRWITLAGDQIISNNSVNLIHDCLDKYVSEREKTNVKGATIQRELSPILSCFRRASKKYRYQWAIEKPYIKIESPPEKTVLTQEEQKRLVDFCKETTGAQSEISICVLLMIQGGMMASEISRLTEDRINLDGDIPHIIVDGKSKTKNRRRIIPIVLCKGIIEDSIKTKLKWLSKTTESNHSRRIKNFLKQATGNEKVSAHCLRHTFKANCIANNASMPSAAVIAGWSGNSIGFSDEMLSYGSKGLSNSDVLKGLWKTSINIHKHLL